MESISFLLSAETFQKYQLMRLETAMIIILPLFVCCQDSITTVKPSKTVPEKNKNNSNPFKTIADIPAPGGFERMPVEAGSFAAWLRTLALKKDKTVYLYNGEPKRNQAAQFAIIDISVGNKDLQQCADAVMRMRAEYLYSRQRFAEIDFTDNNQTHYRVSNKTTRNEFDQYLERVFCHCGTQSLSRQLALVKHFNSIKPGDVLIQGGSPGHAMLVMDMAVNKQGKKVYLLSQSYMPAQDIQIVINPMDSGFSPWYEVSSRLIETPEWVFKTSHLMEWPADSGFK